MEIYTKEITVGYNDLDELQHVNNVQYVQWVQDIAEAHWKSKATDIILKNYFWVLVKHCIQYKSEAKLNDVILLKTYVVKSEGLTSTRKVEMYHKTSGKLIVSSETVWCLMSHDTKKPARISTEIKNLFS
jgi:acyl-CoA thioester hydrolase